MATTGNASAQNNVVTAAEYQAAADEITAILAAQRAERVPIEAEQDLLRNRQELLIARQQSALNTLRAAEADPTDTAFLEQSRLAYARATGEVNTVNTAIQQNRSVLAQSRQASSELQDQRTNLEVKADFAQKSPPTLNSLSPPATTTPDQSATYVPPPPPPVLPTVTPESQIDRPQQTNAASAQNNQTTGAEYQAAADEITAILAAQRAERAPIEAEQDLLRNQQELLIARQQSALNTLRAAEADPSDTAFLEASRTAYARATGEVNANSLAIQQNRSVLGQSLQASAELQDQRTNLEVKADFADRSPPGLNSLTPPATVVPDQTATYVAPPAAPIVPVVAAESQIDSPAQPSVASAGNNQTSAAEYQAAADEVFEIQSAARANSAQLANQVGQDQAAFTAADNQATELRREFRAAEAAGASPAELASLAADYEAQIETTAQLGQQLSQSESALAANQQYRLDLAAQENYLALQASAASSGPPGLNSVPGLSDDPAQLVTVAPPAIPDTFNATPVAGDEALQAFEEAQLAAQEGLGFPPTANPAPVAGDEALQAIEDAEAAALAREEGIAFLEPLAVPASGDEALQAIEDAELAAQEGLAFPPIENPAPVAGDEALQAIEDAEAAELARAEGVAFAEPLDVPASGDEALQAVEDAELAAQEGSAFVQAPEPVGDEALAATQEAELAAIRAAEAQAVFGPAPVVDNSGYGEPTARAAVNPTLADDAANAAAAAQQAAQEAQLREQFTLQQRFNASTQGDWRVRLRLAPGATYLYKAPEGQRGILQPLVATDGVIFPYTPTIQTQYIAKYDSYNLTHSNYRGYFYQNSSVGDIQITGTFTAQDTAEAEYLLAVIHFFRSVTKMFYGKDKFRGAPPPVVELSGFGEYQFNNHPCLVSTFNYTLPKDVDYIQIIPNNQGLNLSTRQPKVSSSPASTLESVQRRLSTSGLPQGAVASPVDLGVTANRVNGIGQTTYVPTKIEIGIVLHPLQTRQQVSQVFSLENFANGNLLKGGFW